jgi:hypothetical protein
VNNAMVWAVLVAVGVAVVSMTLFGARITRRPPPADRIVDDIDTSDPSDPWAAWKPRPFEELDRPRPRLWPVGAALTGLVMVGAGFAGARQTLWATAAADTPDAITTPRPYIVQVEIPPTPTPKPTPVPTATPAPATPKPQVATPAPATTDTTNAPAAATGSAPTLTGSATCSGGILRLSYTASAHGSPLSWLAVYVDGKVVKGGPISGNSHSSSWQGSGSAGDHALEVSVQDKAEHTTRKQFQVRCG